MRGLVFFSFSLLFSTYGLGGCCDLFMIGMFSAKELIVMADDIIIDDVLKLDSRQQLIDFVINVESENTKKIMEMVSKSRVEFDRIHSLIYHISESNRHDDIQDEMSRLMVMVKWLRNDIKLMADKQKKNHELISELYDDEMLIYDVLDANKELI